MIPLTLRRAGPADAQAIRALTRAAYAKWIAVIGREPRPMAADYDRAVREHRIAMAFDSAALVGLVEMIEQPADVLVENLAVDPDHQGRGVGKALLDHAATVAIDRGTPVLRLYTNTRFAENLAFYTRRGFVVEREEASGLGLTVFMIKHLKTVPS